MGVTSLLNCQPPFHLYLRSTTFLQRTIVTPTQSTNICYSLPLRDGRQGKRRLFSSFFNLQRAIFLASSPPSTSAGPTIFLRPPHPHSLAPFHYFFSAVRGSKLIRNLGSPIARCVPSPLLLATRIFPLHNSLSINGTSLLETSRSWLLLARSMLPRGGLPLAT